MRARSLDRALADGAPSESSPALAMRARRLIALPYRRTLARSYVQIVCDARNDTGRSRVHVTPGRRRVIEAADQLIALADALREPGPVAAQGVARALLLLADGTGPLYDPAGEARLADAVAGAATTLPTG